MPSDSTEKTTNRFEEFFDEIEETSIALCLGLMTLLTFSNVIARYLLDINILWALEVTLVLFAWLVLMGMSYGVKKHIHIGVDVIINLLPPTGRKIAALLSITACLAFSILLLIGSWDYWYPFVTERAWLETEDIPMPEILQFLSGWVNEGERYENLPRFIPYLALPLGLSLMTIRFLQVGWKIITNQQDKIIASHEAENMLKTEDENPWK
jgi:C4-dicarboxylate transporter DctQ subunit